MGKTNRFGQITCPLGLIIRIPPPMVGRRILKSPLLYE